MAVLGLLMLAIPCDAYSGSDPTGSIVASQAAQEQTPVVGTIPNLTPTPDALVLKITPDRILEMYNSVSADEAWLRVSAILLPILLVVLTVIVPTLATLYLQTKVGDVQTKLHDELDTHRNSVRDRLDSAQAGLRAELKDDLDRSIEIAKSELNRATADVKETRDGLKRNVEQFVADVERKLLAERATANSSVALLFFHNDQSERAAEFAERALIAVETALAAMSQGTGDLSSADGKSAEARRAEFERFKCSVKSDLAYYLAVSFVKSQSRIHAERALSIARDLPKDWKIYEPPPPISIVDNFNICGFESRTGKSGRSANGGRSLQRPLARA